MREAPDEGCHSRPLRGISGRRREQGEEAKHNKASNFLHSSAFVRLSLACTHFELESAPGVEQASVRVELRGDSFETTSHGRFATQDLGYPSPCTEMASGISPPSGARQENAGAATLTAILDPAPSRASTTPVPVPYGMRPYAPAERRSIQAHLERCVIDPSFLSFVTGVNSRTLSRCDTRGRQSALVVEGWQPFATSLISSWFVQNECPSVNPTLAGRLEATVFCNAMDRVGNPWSISRPRTSSGWSTLPLGSMGARSALHTFTEVLCTHHIRRILNNVENEKHSCAHSKHSPIIACRPVSCPLF